MTERTCSIDGCESPVLAHGWCNRHYLRWRRHGDPTVDLRGEAVTCTMEDCGRKHYARGYCVMHYWRWRRYGDPTVVLRRVATGTCSIEGCGRQARVRGWCEMHYQRWFRHGDPLLTQRPAVADPVCSVEGCDRPHAARGYCATHYARWRNHGASHIVMESNWGRGDVIAPLPSPLTRADRAVIAQTVRVACDGAEGHAHYWTNDERFWARVRLLDAHDAAVYGDELALAAD